MAVKKSLSMFYFNVFLKLVSVQAKYFITTLWFTKDFLNSSIVSTCQTRRTYSSSLQIKGLRIWALTAWFSQNYPLQQWVGISSSQLRMIFIIVQHSAAAKSLRMHLTPFSGAGWVYPAWQKQFSPRLSRTHLEVGFWRCSVSSSLPIFSLLQRKLVEATRNAWELSPYWLTHPFTTTQWTFK